MLSHDCKIRVWYKHTDQMAICHHSNYICYYEAARSELLRDLGMSFAEVERRGIMMPILEVQSKYRKPAYFDELLTVRIILREKPAARINFFYEIYNEQGELINTGMTQLGFIHSDTRRPCQLPGVVPRTAQPPLDGRVAGDSMGRTRVRRQGRVASGIIRMSLSLSSEDFHLSDCTADPFRKAYSASFSSNTFLSWA